MMDQDGLPGLDQTEAAEDGEDYETSGNKLTGSNKLLVFALGEGIDENYNNVRIRVVESKSLKVGKSLKIGKNRIKLEKSDLISY